MSNFIHENLIDEAATIFTDTILWPFSTLNYRLDIRSKVWVSKTTRKKKILKYWSKWRLYTTHEADLFKCRCQEFTYPYLIFPLLEAISLAQSLERKRFWTKIIRITQKSRLGEVTMDVLHLVIDIFLGFYFIYLLKGPSHQLLEAKSFQTMSIENQSTSTSMGHSNSHSSIHFMLFL